MAAGAGPRATAGHPRDGAATVAFDDHHRPDAALIGDCVHCGFCLPACPTYLLWGEEMDSPRGRILLMDLAERGEIGMDREVVGHWDACLGCMACVGRLPFRRAVQPAHRAGAPAGRAPVRAGLAIARRTRRALCAPAASATNAQRRNCCRDHAGARPASRPALAAGAAHRAANAAPPRRHGTGPSARRAPHADATASHTRGRTRAARRGAHRLRAGCLLLARQSRDRTRARGARLRGAHAAVAELLRRARDPRRTRGRRHSIVCVRSSRRWSACASITSS